MGEDEAAPDFSKAAFALPPEVAYLNCAQVSPLHRRVRAAGEAALGRKETPWRAIPNLFYPELETARGLFARLIGAEAGPDAIAMAPSVAYAMAVAAANLPLAPGRSIVVGEGQFPSNHLIWARKAEEEGGRLVVAPPAADGALEAEMLAAIDERTAIVACDPLRWSDGVRLDLTAIAARARAVGAALVLDLTQTAGVAPIDIAALDPDFAAAPAYKWLLGPYAQGFLYVAERHWDGRPLEQTRVARGEDGAYLPGARRFDMGEKANYHLTPMTIAGMELLCALGPERLSPRIAAIADRLAALFEARGFFLTPPALRSPHMFAAAPPPAAAAAGAGAERDAEGWRAALAERDVHVSMRAGALRVSPHLWVDANDEARLEAALAAL